MRRYKYILLVLLASLMWRCEHADLESSPSDSDITFSNVEVLEDGRLRVTATLERLGMTAIDTRASSIEDVIYNGWCLVFGKTDGGENLTDKDSEGYGYGDDSPLIQKSEITANSNGTFFMTFSEFEDIAYMRIIVNLTNREQTTLDKNTNSWQELAEEFPDLGLDPLTVPSHSVVVDYRDNDTYNLGTFGQFRHQSVGLDGIYSVTYSTAANLEHTETGYKDYSGATTYWNINYQTDGSKNTGTNYITGLDESYNENAPDPSSLTTTGFPMASYGFSLENLSETTLANAFGTKIDMIRVCSKVVVDVSEATGFDMQEVYLIDAPQEARIRSTVLSSVTEDSDGNASSSTSFALPVDLGGLITYQALSASGSVSDPIYFYPNSGGDYQYSSTVNNNDGTNPQYIIIKGQAAGYDTPGYYKVALKAQYPLVAEPEADNPEHWSELTYDIMRNTFFTIKVADIDKPGYKTFDDAADVNNPANNISYSIIIEADDSHSEILVSKGTYFVELDASRIYYKGWGSSLSGEVSYSITPNTNCYTPAMYVRGDYGVVVSSCTVGSATIESAEIADIGDGIDYVYIEAANTKQSVTVNYTAYGSGRIRIRVGDMLKFIPVVVDGDKVSNEGAYPLQITGELSTSFAYNGIVSLDDEVATTASIQDIYTSGGNVTSNPLEGFTTRSVAAKIYNADGTALLYFTQASTADADSKNSGNTIDLTGYTGSMADLAADITAILELGYSTVYLEGEYLPAMITSDGSNTTTSSIFSLLEAKEIPYSLDFSGLYTGNTDNTTTNSNIIFRYIRESTFQNLTNLTSITFPSTVDKINAYVFSGCTNLMSVTIGSESLPATSYIKSSGSVTTTSFDGIVTEAFYGMTKDCVVTVYTSTEIELIQYYVSSAEVYYLGTTGSAYKYVFHIDPSVKEQLREHEGDVTYYNFQGFD